ncbi:hypothetical protein BIU90_07065 [Curtobacterium sp. MCBA15_001]|nr:hypothetical protein BIU90_07065 [Curtobacterium sp. MCBA15_001]
MHRWDSVVIEVVAHGDADSIAHAPKPDKPSVDSAQAHPTIDSYVDTTETGDGGASEQLPIGP